MGTMSNSEKQKLQALLNRQIERLGDSILKLGKASKKFSYLRLGYFVAAVAIVYAVSFSGSDVFFFSALIAFIAGFIYLISRHSKINHHRDRLSYLKEVKNQHVARMSLQWEQLPDYKFDYDIKDHPFAGDLNITGPLSVHHLMDTAVYEGGSSRLAEWLLNEHPQKNRILERQNLIRELIPLSPFRDRLQVNAFMSHKKISDKDWSMERLLKWMKIPRKVNFKGTLALLSVLALANIILLITAIAGITGPYVLLTFVAYLGVYNFNSHKISGLFDAAYQINKQLDRFGSLLVYIEQFDFRTSSQLNEFLSEIQNADNAPSVYLKKASRLGGAASLQMNQVLWPLVNMVLPWDIFFSMKMEKLKTELEPKLSQWLETFYELEALNSIANFAALNPGYRFPELETEASILFKAEHLGHPLIQDDQKVCNDFKVETEQDLFLITGSNMAGKSTFLRTVGVNLCLAFAGAPVNADSLQTQLFRLFTSINVKDSLEGGLSHFYAEVRRLRRLLEELEEENELPLFFFVDEIFKGTNNRERFQGSTAFLKYVADKSGIGMVSTHDLELASLESEIPPLSNWHFAETIANGKMSFEYTLKPGPCPTTNALKIMEMEGLPI